MITHTRTRAHKHTPHARTQADRKTNKEENANVLSQCSYFVKHTGCSEGRFNVRGKLGQINKQTNKLKELNTPNSRVLRNSLFHVCMHSPKTVPLGFTAGLRQLVQQNRARVSPGACRVICSPFAASLCRTCRVGFSKSVSLRLQASPYFLLFLSMTDVLSIYLCNPAAHGCTDPGAQMGQFLFGRVRVVFCQRTLFIGQLTFGPET